MSRTKSRSSYDLPTRWLFAVEDFCQDYSTAVGLSLASIVVGLSVFGIAYGVTHPSEPVRSRSEACTERIFEVYDENEDGALQRGEVRRFVVDRRSASSF